MTFLWLLRIFLQLFYSKLAPRSIFWWVKKKFGIFKKNQHCSGANKTKCQGLGMVMSRPGWICGASGSVVDEISSHLCPFPQKNMTHFDDLWRLALIKIFPVRTGQLFYNGNTSCLHSLFENLCIECCETNLQK